MKKRIGLCLLFLFIPCIAGGAVSLNAVDVSNALVPNVTGISSDLAVQVLQMAGFDANIQRGSARTLTVDSQNPRAGALLAVGSEVVLVVGGSEVLDSEPVIATSPDEDSADRPMGVLEDTSTEKKTPSQVILLQKPSVVYIESANSHVRTFLVWYPKKFLVGNQGQ